MKFSIYNHILANGNNYVLYNCFTDKIIFLVPQLEELLEPYLDSIDDFRSVHPDLYEKLKEKKFLVHDTVDEAEEQIKIWLHEENQEDCFTLTINPTMDCNMRCWYCYEKHGEHTQMEENVRVSLQRFLLKKISDPKLKVFAFSFFGGEPLLVFDTVIEPLLETARTLCKQYGKELHVRFTTNGFLLDDRILSRLEDYNNYPVFLQITLDGNRKIHNRTRYTLHGEDTYGRIVEHIHRAVAKNMYVAIRLNYTAKNLGSFVDILDDFKNVSNEMKQNMEFVFHRIWQDDRKDPSLEPKLEEIKSWFRQENLRTVDETKYGKQHCYADYENCAVINYTGEIYKCTARDFNPSAREGILREDGTLEWNEVYKKRMNGKYINKTCRSCGIFPICHGGCSQDKLEQSIPDTCIKGYSGEEKQEIVKGRIKLLLKS